MQGLRLQCGPLGAEACRQPQRVVLAQPEGDFVSWRKM